jgi:hypothetical protein
MQYTLVNFIIHATEVNYEDKLLQTTSVKDMYIHYEIMKYETLFMSVTKVTIAYTLTGTK